MLQRIGRYEILERIGRGGQGTVYRANDTSLDRVVAVKVIDNPAIDEPQYMEALQREARLAASLSHPNIVTVHDFLIEGEFPYIVMEFVPNSLERLIRTGGPIGYERAAEIARNICLGLAHAHGQGVNLRQRLHHPGHPARRLLLVNPQHQELVVDVLEGCLVGFCSVGWRCGDSGDSHRDFYVCWRRIW